MPTTTKKFTARKKIAAAALALTAGVLGTGFAAGVVNFDVIGNNGFGQGQTDVTNVGQTIDITGRLTVERPQTVTTSTTTGTATATLADNIQITGWENLTNAQGAEYEVMVKRGTFGWASEFKGTVDGAQTIKVPMKNKSGATDSEPTEISVILHK